MGTRFIFSVIGVYVVLFTICCSMGSQLPHVYQYKILNNSTGVRYICIMAEIFPL